MSLTFTKLCNSITESTVWLEPAPTRLVWITMLAMADGNGLVFGSVPGLAHKARVDVEDCRKALETFLLPDADSRTKEHEGRRIAEVDGGWELLNHAKYRAIQSAEAVKESKRNYMRRVRAKAIHDVPQNSTVETVDIRPLHLSLDLPNPDPEGDARGAKHKRKRPEVPMPKDFLPSEKHVALAKECRVDLSREFPKFVGHAQTHDRRCANWNAALGNWIRGARDRADAAARRGGLK